MRKFNVVVNGTAYEVEVEEVAAGATSAMPVAAPKAAPVAAAPKAAPAAPKAAPAPAAAPADATVVSSPMPGTIVDVKVQMGQTVKNGDLVAILEAMKMENEIFAPCDGKIVAISTSKGSSVNTGDAIVAIQ